MSIPACVRSGERIKEKEMNQFIRNMVDKARENPQHICFPEAFSADILKTAAEVVRTGIGSPLLIGDPEEITRLAAENDVDTTDFACFNYRDADFVREYAKNYVDTHEGARIKGTIRRLGEDPVRCGMFLLKIGAVDCVAAGKEYATGDIIMEAMQMVGLTRGVESPSSLGIADIPGFEGPQGNMLGIADCAVTAMPDAGALAGIAIASADTVKDLLGWEPRVAMLSFSTTGSAEHESIDVVREAIARVHELRPDILCDGEFQLDSAIIPAVAEHKVNRPSEVAGRANVLIFPNLHAGNIGVKLIQIFGHANAYGPVLQGFAKPVCDFSRSAPVDEMLGNVAMLAIRAAAKKAREQ